MALRRRRSLRSDHRGQPHRLRFRYRYRRPGRRNLLLCSKPRHRSGHRYPRDRADPVLFYDDVDRRGYGGLVIGILATVLTQSSSTTTSIVVGMVAGGLPLATAVPILMGANVGTTMTSSLVSLGAAGDRNQFRRAFSAASVHDMYNLLSVAIFFPLEWAFGILEHVGNWFAAATTGSDGGIIATAFTGFGIAVTTRSEERR